MSGKTDGELKREALILAFYVDTGECDVCHEPTKDGGAFLIMVQRRVYLCLHCAVYVGTVAATVKGG